MTVEAQEGGEITPHEQEMMDLVDNKEAETAGQADPEKAPEYQEETPDTAEQEIDYKAEYEKLKEAQKDAETPEPSEDKTSESVDTPEETPGQLTPDQMGKFTQEYNESGELSEASYGELQKLGLGKDVVDGYIQGQAAIQEAQAVKTYETVGGKEAYDSMINWAKENWTPDQINVFNTAVNSGDDAQIQFGVEALANQFNGAKGSPIPKRALSGSSQGSSSNTNSYESKDDMYKAMSNKLYGKDASYTNMVAKKIANSTF